MRSKSKTNSKWRTTKFFKAWHENQDRERNKGQEKKPYRHQTAARRGARATPLAAPHPCISIEMAIGFIGHRPWPHAPSE